MRLELPRPPARCAALQASHATQHLPTSCWYDPHLQARRADVMARAVLLVCGLLAAVASAGTRQQVSEQLWVARSRSRRPQAPLPPPPPPAAALPSPSRACSSPVTPLSPPAAPVITSGNNPHFRTLRPEPAQNQSPCDYCQVGCLDCGAGGSGCEGMCSNVARLMGAPASPPSFLAAIVRPQVPHTHPTSCSPLFVILQDVVKTLDEFVSDPQTQQVGD